MVWIHQRLDALTLARTPRNDDYDDYDDDIAAMTTFYDSNQVDSRE